MRLALLSLLGALSLSSVAFGMDIGERKYDALCASCHGKDGKAQTPVGRKLKAKDLTTPGLFSKYTDAQLVKKIQEGNPAKKFPAFKNKMSEAEIEAVVAYLRTLK